jgi:hypothetical protein
MDTPIADGKVDGKNISFNIVRVFNGNTNTTAYTGTLGAGQISGKIETGPATGGSTGGFHQSIAIHAELYPVSPREVFKLRQNRSCRASFPGPVHSEVGRLLPIPIRETL